MHPDLFYREIPPIATFMAAILALYGVFRLGMISRWFLLSYPILLIVCYLAVGWSIGMVGFLF